MDNGKTRYRLFAVETGRADEAARERFHLIGPNVTLVYTASGAWAGRAVEVTEGDLWRLRRTEADWLAICNLTLLLEDAERREREIAAAMAEKLNRLEAELKGGAAHEQTG